MLVFPVPFDLAAQASKFSEQADIVVVLGIAQPGRHQSRLSDVEERRLTELAEKLSRQLSGRHPEREPSDIGSILSAYHNWKLNFHGSQEDVDLLARVHAAWLPTYQAALQAFDRDTRDGPCTSWRDEKTYYGRLAIACQPFLAYAEAEPRAALGTANQAAGTELFSPVIVDEWVRHLLDHVQLPVTWAVEADKNVYCARERIRPQDATTEAFIGYLDDTFATRSSYHRFYRQFPVLGRWLAQLTKFVCDGGGKMLERFRRDIGPIGDAFFGTEIIGVSSVAVGKSDFHADGQTVGRVKVQLATGGEGAFIYKPRSIEGEWATQQLLREMAGEGVMEFATYRVVTRNGYGYAELISAARNHVETREDVAAVYEELGGYLAIFHALGGSDLHFENILVADGHLLVCDCETILGVRPLGQDPAPGTVLDSVYRTGMLEWPRASGGGEGAAAMLLSGLAGGERYRIPARLPRLNNDNMSCNVGIIHEEGIEVDPGGTNRVYIGDQIAAPTDFTDAVIRGFDRVHRWFAARSGMTLQATVAVFERSEVRFINFATQLYSQLLTCASHPKCLMEPLQVDLVFNRLAEHPQRWDRNHRLVDSEVAALWQFDVPIYTVGACEEQLMVAHREAVPFPLAASPLQDALARIGRLTPETVRGRGSTLRPASPSRKSTAPSSSPPRWSSPDGSETNCAPSSRTTGPFHRGTTSRSPRPAFGRSMSCRNLFDGTAGIGLFLAYLDSFVEDDRFRTTAQRALAHAVANCSRDRIRRLPRHLGDHLPPHAPGSIVGRRPPTRPSGRIEPGHRPSGSRRPALRHLERSRRCYPRDARPVAPSGRRGTVVRSRLCPSRPRTRRAGRLRRQLAAISRSRRRRQPYGLLPWAERHRLGTDLAWGRHRPPRLRHHRPGRFQVRENALRRGKAGLVRPTYQYFGHGARCAAFRERLVQRGGRHLSRIAAWDILGRSDDELLKEANIALVATLRNFHSLGNDSLCHGRSGNGELFLRFAQIKDEPIFQMEANLQAQAQWNDLDGVGRALDSDVSDRVFPGLMIGLAVLGSNSSAWLTPTGFRRPCCWTHPRYFLPRGRRAMSVDTCASFLDLLSRSPELSDELKAMSDLREILALGRRCGYVFDAETFMAAMSKAGDRVAGLFAPTAPLEPSNRESTWLHHEFDLDGIPALHQVVDLLQVLKVKPATVDLYTFASSFVPEDLAWTGMSPADPSFHGRYQEIMGSSWDKSQPEYTRRDFHLVNLDRYVDDPSYEAYFCAKVRMVSALEEFFGTGVRFSGSMWYPPSSYRLWHTNETQPGWRMYVIDFDAGCDGSAGRSFFRYMNPETQEVVTLEERSRVIRFFKIEQNPKKLFWHCIVNPTPNNRWSFGFEMPERALERLVV